MKDIDYDSIFADITGPVVFCDTGHIIRYLNVEAIDKYAKRGGTELIGCSIFDCHNQASNKIISKIFHEFQNGLDEQYLCVSEKTGKKVFMCAVRGEKGTLLGYFERYREMHDGVSS